MTDTKDVLAELERLHEAATPGPWEVNPFLAQIDAFAGGEPLPVCRMLWPTEERTEAETLANTELIALTRNALPALLEVAKAARDLRHMAVPGSGWHTTPELRIALRSLDEVKL